MIVTARIQATGRARSFHPRGREERALCIDGLRAGVLLALLALASCGGGSLVLGGVNGSDGGDRGSGSSTGSSTGDGGGGSAGSGQAAAMEATRARRIAALQTTCRESGRWSGRRWTGRSRWRRGGIRLDVPWKLPANARPNRLRHDRYAGVRLRPAGPAHRSLHVYGCLLDLCGLRVLSILLVHLGRAIAPGNATARVPAMRDVVLRIVGIDGLVTVEHVAAHVLVAELRAGRHAGIDA